MKTGEESDPRSDGWNPQQHLGHLAQWVFVTRNAAFFPARDRKRLKASMRPDLRAVIHTAREARDALRAGDRERARRLCLWGMYSYALVLLEQEDTYYVRMLKRSAMIANLSAKGGAATKHHRPELEQQIKGCLQRGEAPRRYIKEWADEHNVSADTVRRRVREIKKQLGLM